MIGDAVRKKSENILGKIGRALKFIPVSANVFSAAAILWSILFVVFLLAGWKIPAFLFFLLSVVWDGIDGAFAHARNDVTKFGYYIEGIIDKWAEIIIYVGIFLTGYWLEMILFTSFALMLSFAKPRAAMVVYIGEFDWPAIGERLERLAIIGVALFLDLAGIGKFSINGVGYDLTSVIIYMGVFVLAVGNIQRIFFAKKIIEHGGIGGMKIKDRLKK